MRKLLIISFLLMQFGTYAQNESNWNIGVEFSIDDLSSSDFIYTNRDNKSLIVFDNSSYNYSLGLAAKYLVQEKLGLSIGILYANKDGTFASNCEACNWAASPIEQRFITVPLSINYTFLTGKLNPIVNGGIKNNFEIRSDVEDKSNGYFMEAFIGASMHYDFLENWNAGIGYNYQRALSDFYGTDDFNLKTNSFILQFNYTLK